MRDEIVRVACCAGALLLACGGGGGGGGSVPGCNRAAVGFCIENYQANPGQPIDWEAAKQDCLDEKGAWEPCPAAGRAGVCTVTFGGSWEYRSLDFVLYAGLICSAAEGADFCSSLGGETFDTSFAPGSATCGAPVESTISCDRHSAPTYECSTVSGGISPERLALAKSSCASIGGTLGTTCPTTNLAATCEQSSSFGLVATDSYYTGADLAEAETVCADEGGTWTLN